MQTEENLFQSTKFKIGVLLIILNFPMGWIFGPIIALWVGNVRDNASLGVAVGVGFYLLSWMMLGIGTLLAGKHGLETAKRYRRRRKNIIERFHRWEEIRSKRLKEEMLKVGKKVSSSVLKKIDNVRNRRKRRWNPPNFRKVHPAKSNPFSFRIKRKKEKNHASSK